MPKLATLLDDDQLDDDQDPLQPQRSRRYSRKQQARHQSRPSLSELIASVAEPVGLEGGFVITYKPALYEEIWLLSSLRPFYDEHLITDVLASVKGGKEASVYRCEAEPSTSESLLAAKVYRPRQFRNLRNDKMYTEGRTILTDQGRPVKNTDHRLMRAIGKKTAFGQQVTHTSWLMYEHTTLERLHKAGAAVPKPFAVAENAILMSYIGDEQRAAPTLHEIRLPVRAAQPLFDEVLRNIELLLQYGLIHGDLSAYNILYWQGAITLIDFPQVTNSANNPHARMILTRDITRICQYFSQYGIKNNPSALATELWDRYQPIDPDDLAADLSALEEL